MAVAVAYLSWFGVSGLRNTGRTCGTAFDFHVAHPPHMSA